MKKIIAFSFAIVLWIAVLTGCETTITDNASNPDPIESYDEESRVFIDTASIEPSSDTSVQIPSGGSFLVKEKKYVYFEKDIIILDVTNETDKNYSITITGNYFDADGNVLKAETQTTKGFATGYQKYYIFMPNMNFDSFAYTLEFEEYNGACLEAKIVTDFHSGRMVNGWAIDGNGEAIGYHQRYPVIMCDVNFNNQNSTDVTLVGTLIVWDNHNNLHCIWTTGMESASAGDIAGQSIPIYYELTDEKIEWPEHLTGELNMAFTIDAIFTDYYEAENWLDSEGVSLQKFRRQYGTPGKRP